MGVGGAGDKLLLLGIVVRLLLLILLVLGRIRVLLRLIELKVAYIVPGRSNCVTEPTTRRVIPWVLVLHLLLLPLVVVSSAASTTTGSVARIRTTAAPIPWIRRVWRALLRVSFWGHCARRISNAYSRGNAQYPRSNRFNTHKGGEKTVQ